MSLFKISLAAALAVSTMTTPLLAQSAASLSIAGTMRAGASVSGASQLNDDDDSLIPAIALLAIMTAIIVLTGGGDNDDLPRSA